MSKFFRQDNCGRDNRSGERAAAGFIDSGKDLDSLLISFDHASMHANAVSNFELGDILLLLFFDEIDDPVHEWFAGGARLCNKSGELQPHDRFSDWQRENR